MKSSGIRRGLAALAVSAIAAVGLPLAAHADTVDEQVDACDIYLYSGLTGIGSVKHDGTNTTVTLEAGAGSDISQLTFQYRIAPAGAWQTIDTTSRNDNGAFKHDWAVPNAILGVPIDLRAVGDTTTPDPGICGNANTTQVSNIASTTILAADNADAEALELTTADEIGIYQSPSGGQWVAVNGTTSAPDANDGDPGYALAPAYVQAAGGGAGDGPVVSGNQTGDVEDGKFNVAFDMNLFAGYNWDVTVPTHDELTLIGFVEDPDSGNITSDPETYVVYKQVLTAITATPNGGSISDAPGATRDVTLTVTDQKGKPIAGAEVYRGAVMIGVTDGLGQVETTQGQGTVQYYVNATGTPGYNGAVGDKEVTVTFTPYVPRADEMVFLSNDGAAFDFDEYSLGDLRVRVRDQNDAAFEPDNATQTLRYRWTVTPFDGTAVRKSGWYTAGPGGVDDLANGLYNVRPLQTEPFDVNHPPADPGVPTAQFDTEGTWELEAELTGDGGGNNALPKTVLGNKVKTGEAFIEFDGFDPQWADVNTTATITGKLQLDDGTALPQRNVKLDWTKGPNGTPPFEDEVSDAVMNGGNSQVKKTGNDGTFSVSIRDVPDGPAKVELDGVLTAITVPTPGIGINPDTLEADGSNPPSHGLDFVTDSVPAQTEIDLTNATPGVPLITGETPGKLQVVRVDLEDNFGHALPGRKVELTVDQGFFIETRTTGVGDLQRIAEPDPANGADFGGWASVGKEITVTTDGGGTAFAVISIARNTGFDDNGRVSDSVVGTIGGFSDTQAFNWDTINDDGDDSLNISSIEFVKTPDADQDGPTDPAPVGQEVAFDVYAKDQFGNLVQGVGNDADDWIDVTCTDSGGDDHPCPAFGGLGGPGSSFGSDFDDGGDFWTWSDEEGTFNFLAKLEYLKGVEWDAIPGGFDIVTDVPDRTLAQEGDVVTDTFSQAWYEVDLGASSYTIDQSPDNPAPVDQPITVTVDATDQEGNPIEGLRVEFIRIGDPNQIRHTDGNGMASYTFHAEEDECGTTETVTAEIYDGDTFIEQLNVEVVYQACTNEPEEIQVGLTGRNSENGRRDILDVTAATVEDTLPVTGADVDIFKMKNGDWVQVGNKSRTLNSSGEATFKIRDRNGNAKTTYKAVIGATPTTAPGESDEYSRR